MVKYNIYDKTFKGNSIVHIRKFAESLMKYGLAAGTDIIWHSILFTFLLIYYNIDSQTTQESVPATTQNAKCTHVNTLVFTHYIKINVIPMGILRGAYSMYSFLQHMTDMTNSLLEASYYCKSFPMNVYFLFHCKSFPPQMFYCIQSLFELQMEDLHKVFEITRIQDCFLTFCSTERSIPTHCLIFKLF